MTAGIISGKGRSLKVNLYEDLLNTGLGLLHTVVDQADHAAAAAILLASALPSEQEAAQAG